MEFKFITIEAKGKSGWTKVSTEDELNKLCEDSQGFRSGTLRELFANGETNSGKLPLRCDVRFV